MNDEQPRKKITLDLEFFGDPRPPAPGRVHLLPANVWLQLEPGESVFEAAKRSNIGIPTTCGGKGTCGLCRVLFPLPAREPTYVERQHIDRADLARGVRLACRSRPTHDLAITVLPEPRLGRK
ncbi:MAG: nqrF 3 [Chloroflexi bacterium]|nr:nqrF 3 [Chloroflexota bacterium]